MKKNTLLLIIACLFTAEKINAQGERNKDLNDRGYYVTSRGDTVPVKGRTLNQVLQSMWDGAKYENMRSKKFGFLWWSSLDQQFTDIPGDSESYSGSLPGVRIGINTPLLLTKKMLAVTAGLEYSMEGSKYESSNYIPGGQEQKVENEVRLNYLRLPITARKYTRSGFYGEAGIQPGLLLSAKDKFDGQTASLKDDYNSFDMGLRFGVGYDFKKRIGMHAHFAPGISNINKKGGPNDGKKDRNRSFGFGISYYL